MMARAGLIRAYADAGSPEDRMIADGPVWAHKSDRPLQDARRRPCARCSKRFQPTRRRRMLCDPCFRTGGSGME